MLFMSLPVSIQLAAAGSATVSKQVLCKGIDKSQSTWQLIDITDTFSTADQTIFNYVELANVNPPINIKFVWVPPYGIESESIDYNDAVRTYTTVENDPINITWEGSGFIYAPLNVAKWMYDALPVGVWKAQVYGDNTLLSTAQFTLQPAVDIVSKTFSPKEGEPVYAGDTVTATYELQNAGNTILKAVNFALATPLPQGVSLVEATPPRDMQPGSTETFVLKMKFTSEGTYSPTIQLIINEELIEGGALEVQVSPAPFSWTLIIAGIVGIAVVVLVAVLLMRRRKSSRPAVPPMPYVPPQPSPVMPQATKYCTSCDSPIPQEARYHAKWGTSQG